MRLVRNIAETVAICLSLGVFFALFRDLTFTQWVVTIIGFVVIGVFLGVLWYLFREPARRCDH